MLFRLELLSAAFLFMVCLKVEGFEEKTFAAQLEAKCQDFQKKTNAAGLCICVVRGSYDLEKPYQKTFYFGDARRHPKVLFKETTVFKIGEVSKSFLACLLFSLSEEGKLSLSDQVNSKLPKTLQVPISHGKPITLLDLAQHTSGLPDLPLFPLKRASAILSDVQHYFDQAKSFKKPGINYLPSDLGYALLCKALSFSEKKSLDQLLTDKFFTPLDMKNTSIEPKKFLLSNLATGYNGLSLVAEEKTDRSYSFFHPTSGILSTGDDMLSFLSFLLSIKTTGESKWLKKFFQTTFTLENSSICKAVFPWMVSHLSYTKSLNTYRISGEYYGFSSSMAIIPETKNGVFIVTNSDYSTLELANQILSLLHD